MAAHSADMGVRRDGGTRPTFPRRLRSADDVEGRSLIGKARQAAGLAAAVLSRPGREQGESHERTAPLRPLRVPRPGRDRVTVRAPGLCLHEVLDHTSVLKLVEQKWNLPALTARDAAACAPLTRWNFSRPPAFLVPPSLPGPASRGAAGSRRTSPSPCLRWPRGSAAGTRSPRSSRTRSSRQPAARRAPGGRRQVIVIMTGGHARRCLTWLLI